MLNPDIAQQRLYSQKIAANKFEKPAEVVQWLGAVQSQDYGMAKWALGLRLQGVSDPDIDRALADGTILRTHVLRPTWHFVTPTDIRWMLALTAPRVKAAMAYYNRKFELDDAIFLRSQEIMVKALEGDKQLTRPELMIELEKAGIATDDLRLTNIMMRAELDGVICSGARRGKQFTYALLDERAPQTRVLTHDEALAQLTKCYFTGHGPATLQDYSWWSGLTITEAKAGLDMVASQLMNITIAGQTYWFGESTPFLNEVSPTIYLLPYFDEYTVGYTDRSAVIEEADNQNGLPNSNSLNPVMVCDGLIIGTWKRTIRKDKVVVETNPFRPLTPAESVALSLAAEAYGQFVGLPVTLF